MRDNRFPKLTQFIHFLDLRQSLVSKTQKNLFQGNTITKCFEGDFDSLGSKQQMLFKGFNLTLNFSLPELEQQEFVSKSVPRSRFKTSKMSAIFRG